MLALPAEGGSRISGPSTKWRVLGAYSAWALVVLLLVGLASLGLVLVDHDATAIIVSIVGAVGVAAFTVGCFAPNNGLFGRVAHGRGVTDDVVAITFDDGPSAATTPLVLDALAAANARATFFLLGKHARAHPELVERIVRDGHEIANHGDDHGILVFANRSEVAGQLLRAERSLNGFGAPLPRLFRAPHGYTNPIVPYVARRLGYRVIGWSKGVFDTSRPGADAIVSRASKALRPGAILLLHDADGSGLGDRSQTAEALPRILAAAADKGLGTVTASELVALEAPAERPSVRAAAFGLGGAAVTIALLWSLGHNRLVGIETTFSSLSIPLVIAALLANFLSVAMKATVWKETIEAMPDAEKASYGELMPSLFVGFLLNTLLPARLGEIARVLVFRRRLAKRGSTMSAASVAGSVVMEQVVGAITLAITFVTLFGFLPASLNRTTERIGIAFVALIAAVALTFVALEVWARSRRRRGAYRDPDRRSDASAWWERVMQQAGSFARSIGSAQSLWRQPRRAGIALSASILSWVAQIAGIWLTLRAFHIEGHGIGRAALVFVVSNVIGLVPITPGGVGSFQVAVSAALAQVGVSTTTGLGFGVGLQAIEVTLGVGLGLVFMSREGLSLGELRRGIRAVEEGLPASEVALPLDAEHRRRVRGMHI